MAADQRNFQNYLYIDDNAVHWTKRGETDAVRNAVDGSASGDGSPTWKDGPRQRARKVIYQDATTFRTKSVIVYTPTAFAAIALGATLAFHVENLTTTVSYTAIKKLGEKQPSRGSARQLADHA